MKFNEALENMLAGRKVFLPDSTYFQYIYFDKEEQCFKYNFGDVFEINSYVVKDGWELYKSTFFDERDSKQYIVRQGFVKEIENIYKGLRTVNYNLVEEGTRIANDSIDYLCDSKGFSLKTGRNHAFREETFKNKGYM